MIFNRCSIEGFDTFAEIKAQCGFKVILDLDDYWNLYAHHHEFGNWINAKMPRWIMKNIHLADAITVTHSLLAEKVLEVKPDADVHVIPNGLPFDEGQYTRHREEDDRVRLLYAGGASHVYDVAELRAPLQQVNETLAGHEIILAGYKDNPEKIKSQWDRMLETFYPHLQAAHRPIRRGKPLSKYMQIYEEADVVLAPLEDNEFNRYKSNLKVLEAGCKGAAVIASAIHPYDNPLDREFLTFADSSVGWYEAMRYHIRNPQYCKDMGQALAEHVRKHYHIDKINLHRRQLLEHMQK